MNESLPRRFATVTRQASTAGVVLILAYLLSQFLPHGAVGEGDPVDPSPSRSAESNRVKAPVLPAISSETDQVQVTPARVANPLASGVLTVLIDEHEYFIVAQAGESAETRSATLSQVTQLAQQATGDANGIRVRILRRTTARAAAEQRLLQDLAQIGVDADHIYMPMELEP